MFKWLKENYNKEVYMCEGDVKAYKYILSGMLSFFVMLVVICIAIKLVIFPFKIAEIYNLNFNVVAEKIFEKYNITILIILSVSIFVVPLYYLVLKMKKFGKDGIEFEDAGQKKDRVEKTNTHDLKDKIEIILNSNDGKKDDEPIEKELFKDKNKTIEKQNEEKCKSVINSMQLLTKIILKKLATKDIIINIDTVYNLLVGRIPKHKFTTKFEIIQQAQNIIDFLNNNDIIESDEGENVYYITEFGKSVLKQLGIKE